ncbi:MAG: PilZ domain-containing protein [Candidatus Omnitrophica bacterium]|nr:PilZ domain-containing protein [Candidatus Omnitrophota bacterium]
MEERRGYIRISTVLPVEFCALDENKKRITPWLQGFTQDIGKGGICLVVNDLWWGFWDKFNPSGTVFTLKINLALKRTIETTAISRWRTQERGTDFTRYIIGLEFLNADARDKQALFNFALLKKYLPIALTLLLGALLIFSFSLTIRNAVLNKENRLLVEQYVHAIEKGSNIINTLDEQETSNIILSKRQNEVASAIVSLEKQISQYSGAPEGSPGKNIAILQKQLDDLKRESIFLKNKAKERSSAVSALKNEADALSLAQFGFSEKISDGVYDWIKNRQDLKQGLVISFEGDRNLEKVCFTYDQAIAAIVFIVKGDTKSAARILDFYLRKANSGENIYNAYYSNGEVAEYIIHSGPNAWIGLAALNYTKKTGDKRYLNIAQSVAEFLKKMMDSEGGIKGDPADAWYATEHNLDSFAFFKLYNEVTGKNQYLESAEKIKGWISRYSYTTYGPPVKRGKGDATIATDTYAWSVSTFGPKALLDLRMDPDAILDFAVENCEVTAGFKRKEGEVSVRGFDFAKFKNMPRGGVVSGEWTAQMVLSFEIMADYYQDKDADKYNKYLKQSILYFNELQKMLITSPSKAGRVEPCLPYASSALVDTGHGWRTPNGNSTGSLSSTVYFLIAYYGYNPFTGEFLDFSLKKIYEKRSHKTAASAR